MNLTLADLTDHGELFLRGTALTIALTFASLIAGMALGILLETFNGVNTPLEWSSLPWTWLAMIITLGQGLAFAFLGSALWMRGRPYTLFGPLAIVAFGVAVGLGQVNLDGVLWGLYVQSNQSPLIGGAALGGCVAIGLLASALIIDDFDVSVVQREEMFVPIYNRLGFLGDGEIRLIVAKEFVDLFRSGSIKKMTVSYAVPLLVLLGMAWLVDFAEAPIPINLLSYAPFLGFFGFNFYSWLYCSR